MSILLTTEAGSRSHRREKKKKFHMHVHFAQLPKQAVRHLAQLGSGCGLAH